MSTEAQRLISVSLTKIAQSRSQRGGVSLHKNLLVATVLQRARYIFMEEAYHMVQVHSAAASQPRHPQQQPPQQQPQDEYDEDSLVALTAEEAGCESSTATTEASSTPHLLPPSCERCCPEEDKENQLPPPYTPGGDHPTYLDLDKEEKILKERTNSPPPSSPSSKGLKRRRVAEWETEEAISSILPKRVKSSTPAVDADESVFLDDASLGHSDTDDDTDDDDDDDDEDDDDDINGESSMEIDRITSLVSIFSFGGLGDASIGKLTRSVSTPDLCSSQAKEGVVDSLQQRQFLAMTV